ncbi:hypothetical protein IVB69_13285 [Flavobacterium sp. J49]|uniref:hypothetical protein n=1 Tax=Flavobacterium sp. J49 TaxID=2718534 RepID=UPI0015931B57|nr:hypothetical protein [Flavobacterium sp. J49]MBF6642458.1 hypothetical protein [Flavobacterium sp. J49]NIC03704.1 hypothetical protein [Flavobacterium sp. J49]
MKNLIFGLIATVMFGFIGNAQTNKDEWKSMMNITRSSIDDILDNTRPKEMDLENYKQKLILGELQLSEDSRRQIEPLMEPLKKYGQEIANLHKLTFTDDSELIALAAFEPDSPINDGQYEFSTFGLTGSEIATCALVAIGADALYSLAFSGATSWSAAALTSTFSAVAKRFLGPIGVTFAVVSFGICILEQSQD